MSAIALSGRITLLVMLVLTLVIGASLAINQSVWQRMLYEETLADAAATAADLRAAIEENLRLGIPLETLGSAQQLVERTLRAGQEISDIAIVDPHGTILFDSEPLRVGTTAPAGWEAPETSETRWTSRWEGELLGAAMITDSDQRQAGTVVVVVGTGAIEARLAGAMLKMARAGVLLLLIGTLTAAALSGLATREIRRWSRERRRQIEAAAAGGGTPVHGAPVVALVLAAGAALDACETELLRMGTGGDDLA
jgi:sensor histidine kinase regulating citrate/malate metabolism